MADKNPHYELVLEDVRATDAWRTIDSEILKRRMCERSSKRMKPYPNAPNFVVPIVDDATREKTTQEINMMMGAPRFAHVIPLSAAMPSDLRSMAEVGFDTYLRHVVRAAPKFEEAVDTKNARGFSILKIFRENDDVWGVIPTFDVIDPRDLIIPAASRREIQRASRLTHIYRYSEDEFARAAKDNGWLNVESVREQAMAEDRESPGGESGISDALEATKHLIGITTSGPGSKTIVVWEHWHYAKEWDVLFGDGNVSLGEKCCSVFSPDAPDFPLAVFPWREEDEVVELQGAELQMELSMAMMEGRSAVTRKVVSGKARPWPFVQTRFENRSKFFHDTRGVGHLCMDDQISATATKNAKATFCDYLQLPLFKGPGSRTSTNVSYEPGSFLPEGMEPVQMPQVPAQFDFDIENDKRTAARRVGALSQYQYSGNLTSKKGIQKTATEVQDESMRGTMMSSGDVDRFNHPLVELYQQLWADLKRIGYQLPLIDGNDYQGVANTNVYAYPVLVVPASNAKTMNPDLQFQRAMTAWNFAASLIPLGVGVDANQAGRDILTHWDAVTASKWIIPPDKAGPGGLPPVYQVLKQLTDQITALSAAVKQIGQAVVSESERVDRVSGGGVTQ